MMNGPRGRVAANPTGGVMSPITMGLLALLAYKAMKGGGIFGSAGAAQQPYTPGGTPPRANQDGSDWLGSLGKLIAGGAAGGILSNGLGQLVKNLQNTGQGQVAQSWVGTGPNTNISPSDLEKAAGADTLDALAQHTGMSREDLLAELSQQLPQAVNTLTPQGRLPSEDEAAAWL
jgi:uncharacterized protein YidB (DUF937 family)/uncharacterized membrane protein YeaQ/YmgE (transglycosylase-associated protein family)